MDKNAVPPKPTDNPMTSALLEVGGIYTLKGKVIRSLAVCKLFDG
jgi:hypothetical protein